MKDDMLTVVNKDKPVTFFGKDFRQVECLHSSFICGIYCGIVAGLGCFLVTSKTLPSYQMAFAGLWVGFLGFWVPCRYKYESSTLLLEAAKAGKLKNPPTDSEEKS